MKRSIRSALSKSRNALILAALLLAPLAAADEAHAGAALWQETNFQYLLGRNFKLPDDDSRSTITVEHANAWKYGDNFLFFDVTNPLDGDISVYGELSPRLSIGKISGKNLSAPFIKDVLLAGTLEAGTVDGGEGFHNYLYGVGLSLNLPGYNFADLNLYLRNSDYQGTTYQLTHAWQLPFTLGKGSFIFEGFTDIAGGEGSSTFNIDAQPRLLLDLGKCWDAPGSLYVGTEVIYWRNKFGIKGVNEFAPQAMVKWVM